MEYKEDRRMFGPHAFNLLKQYTDELMEDEHLKVEIKSFLRLSEKKFYKEIDPFHKKRKEKEEALKKAQDALGEEFTAPLVKNEYIPETFIG